MAGKIKPETIVIKDYLQRFKKTGDRTIARKIFKENPELFESEQHVYGRVRYFRGSQGKSNRKYLKDEGLQKELNKIPAPLMPKSESELRKIYNIPVTIKSLGVFGDLHIPYHDEKAIDAALDEFEKEKVDAIFINGDLLDFYQLSFHEKDPRKIKFKDEIEMGTQFFAYIRHRFPDIPIYFIPGNHENRFERYLRVNAAAFLDIEEFRLDVLLKVGEHRITYIPFRTVVTYGDMLIEHGDKIPGAGGVVPARTALMRFKRNIIVNHFHKTSESSQRIFDPVQDNVIRGYSLGCMCELSPEYMEINEWNHGFCRLVLQGNKTKVFNYKVVNGVIL